MLADVVIVGAGPVGATLALALADGDLDVLVLDARAAGETLRGDRSLALSHGARLILERIGVWGALAATPDAATPITRIDISQAGGFGAMELAAEEQGVPALGYVVSYRALQAALDAALARSRVAVRHATTVSTVGGTPAYAAVTLAATGIRAAARAARRGRRRDRRDRRGDHAAPPRLRAGRGHRQGLERNASCGARVRALHARTARWRSCPKATTTASSGPQRRSARRRCRPKMTRPSWPSSRGDSRDAAARSRRSASGARFRSRWNTRASLPAARCVVLGNAAQTLHPVAGQGFNVGLRDAWELSQIVLDTPRDAVGEAPDDRPLSAGPAHRSHRRHRVHARSRRDFRKRCADRPLAARVGAYFARRGAGGEARIHARDALRAALNRRRRFDPAL